jgi:monoterpene epsilon-lactone hydrolase
VPSWQAQCFNAGVRRIIRRRKWGEDEEAVVRRARRLLGAPLPLQWFRARGLRLVPIRDGGVHGEWVEPKRPDGGAILYVHGGGYVSCSSATHRPITAALARLSRHRVFSLDYRLAPEDPFPAALDDAVTAYRWLLGQGLLASTLSLAGDSAGGGLVLGLLLRVRDAGLPLPACAVCFSPWTDLAGTGASVRLNDGRCAMFYPENIPEFAAAYLNDASPLDPFASPVFADLKGLPPLLLQVSSTELLLDDASRVHHKIQATGGISRLEIYDDVFHVWQMLDGIVPEAGVAMRQATAFIRDHV